MTRDGFAYRLKRHVATAQRSAPSIAAAQGRHHRSGFDCGVERLNNFLNLSAKKQQKDDMTRVYVAVVPEDTAILGYHAINVGTMNVAELAKPPSGTPSHGEIPVLFLGQVAVDLKTQGLGIGGLSCTIFLRKPA